MKFIELTILGLNQKCLINLDNITVITKSKRFDSGTAIYFTGGPDDHTAVEEDYEIIKEEIINAIISE